MILEIFLICTLLAMVFFGPWILVAMHNYYDWVYDNYRRK